MKKFHFKLEKVLNIREKLELQQKNKLAIAAAEYQKIIRKKEAQIIGVNKIRKDIYKKTINATISIDELQTLDELQKKIDRFSRGLIPEIEEKKQKMEYEKKNYDKLQKDRKSIEILKENALKIYKHSQLKFESQVLDEIRKKTT